MSRSELAGFVMGTVFSAAGAMWGWLGGSCADLDPCVGVRNCVYPSGPNRRPRSVDGGEGAP